MTNFSDSLHEDLFNLFILKFMDYWYTDTRFSRSIDLINFSAQWIKDLFPQENHPESYVRYIDDEDLRHLPEDGNVHAFFDCKDSPHNKVIITIGDEG